MAKKAKKAKKVAKAKPEGAARGGSDKKLDQILTELHGIRAELKRLHGAVRVVAPSSEPTGEDLH